VNIAIVTTAYNGYQRFIPQWLEAISKLKDKPTEVVIAMEKWPDKARDNMFENLDKTIKELNVRVVEVDRAENMGHMRNIAVAETSTEWVMYLSVDDVILPNAINELKKHDNGDYICITWKSVATWTNDEEKIHKGITPEEMVLKHNGKGFIVGHSPFKRWIWEKNPYMEHDYPNAPFLAGAVENGAKFTKTGHPCTLYLRRLDSHARLLGRRKETLVLSEKKQALYWKRDQIERMRKYYDKIK
jgi:hypothetical protein